MSQEAIQLAQQVNQRQAIESVKAQVQLHKAGLLRKNGHEMWNRFAVTFRQEVNDFNKHLNAPEYVIESFDDTSTAYTIKMHSKAGVSVTCGFDIEGQRIALTGSRPNSPDRLTVDYELAVDDNDKVIIRNGEGTVIGALKVALDALEYFAK